MSTRTITMNNNLISTNIQFFCMLCKEIICSLTIIHRLWILSAHTKCAVIKGCYRNSILICPIFNCSCKAETCCKSSAWNYKNAWTISLITPFPFSWICNKNFYFWSIWFINTTFCFIFCYTAPIIIWQVIFKSIFRMCCKFLSFFK